MSAISTSPARTDVEPRTSTASVLPGTLGVLLAGGLALALHDLLPDLQRVSSHTGTYAHALAVVLTSAVLAAAVSTRWLALRRKLAHDLPLWAVALGGLAVWDVVTLKANLLPLPYFPGPAMVLRSLRLDAALLFESTWRSGLLLLTGYLCGATAGLVCGVLMGWSHRVHYWVMPALKIIGPLPATAWIPIALVVFPSSFWAAVFLIALAVWFPVTVLTMSGVSNVRQSYLDVARTLGAGRGYLILRVALPSALPSIFIGLFMGLGMSFLTLIVAEMLGVKAGLGWYVQWANGWAEFSKVYAALLITAVFFSAVMTLLFRLRDRLLAWQQGVIKW